MEKGNIPREIRNWYSETINIDIDTGEIIDNQTRDKEYIIIKKNKTTKYEKSTGIITHTNECKRKQYRQGTIL